MFGSIRQGSLVYVLGKGEEPFLSVAQVVSVTPPRPKVGGNFVPGPMQLEQVVDISVKVGDDTKTFSNVGTHLSVFDTGAGGYVVSDDRAVMTNEVEAFGANSRNALDSVPYHRKVVDACKKMMSTLNPGLLREEERDAKIGSLEKEMSEIRACFAELSAMLKDTSRQRPSPEKNH